MGNLTMRRCVQTRVSQLAVMAIALSCWMATSIDAGERNLKSRLSDRQTWSPAAPTAATIQHQPSPVATILGGRAVFSVIAGGAPPFSYQWRKDGLDLSDDSKISGASTSALMLKDVSFAEAGNYSVMVTDALGSTTSNDAALTVGWPQGGDVDFSFNPGSSISGTVLAMAVQPDGKTIIAGDVTSSTDAARGRVVRVNVDGSTDHTFGNGFAGANNTVYSLALQPDGRVLIAGDFSTVNGVARNSIARLNADGSLDTTFLNGLGGVNGKVLSLVLQPDGRVLMAGGFTIVNGVVRNHVARLNADGSLDTTFLNGLAGPNNGVQCLALQSDGRVLIAGFFTAVNGVSRNYVARLNADGSVDPTFLDGLAGPTDWVYSIAVQSDGRVLIGGGFMMVNGVGRNLIARLNPDGSLDTTFMDQLDGVNSWVNTLAALPDGDVLIGGEFTTVNGVIRNKVARLEPDGSLDTGFLSGLAGANGSVFAVAAGPDARVMIGGSFTTMNGVGCNRVARLNEAGTVDTSFQNGLAGANGGAYSLALQSDGRMLVGGTFTTINGVSRNRIARLNPDGSLDGTFLGGLAGANSWVRALTVQPDGRVLIGGLFTRVNGVTRNFVARLDANGSLDMTFLNGLSGANGWVYSFGVQPDGRVLIGGEFTAVNGTSRNRIARLNPDGSLDPTFQNGLAGADGAIYSIAVQPDGRVLIGGYFSTVNGVSRNNLARLNTDGSLDTTFLEGMTGTNSGVRSIAVQSDGRVLIGGVFSAVHGVGRLRLARLNGDGSLDPTFLNGLSGANGWVYSLRVQTDGQILMGGDFTAVNGVNRQRVARLNPDGTVDATLLNGLAGVNNPVHSLSVQPDGGVVMAGFFGGVNGVPRTSVARIYGTEIVAAPSITLEPSAQTSYEGCCAVFHVGATGSALAFRWRKDGLDLVDGGSISGASSSTLRISGIAQDDAGDYSVAVTNVLGRATSAEATLAVLAIPQCKVATCDAELGCVLVDAINGAACSDGNSCTLGDTCMDGACVGGPTCDDGNVCTDGMCDPEVGCVYTNNTVSCDDGNACTTLDACAEGSCVGGMPRVCEDGNVCTDDSCNPAVGCVFVDHTAACDDGNACTDDTCDPATGCVYTNNTASCDDGNACTSNDFCNAGVCAGACSCLTAADSDGDGFGDHGGVVLRCDASVPASWVTNAGDCNDANPAIHPGATEVCNLVDDDCDLQVDEGLGATFYADLDGDHYGDPSSPTHACSIPAGYSLNALDCDDTDATVHPMSPERCDGKRNDCGGTGWPALLDDDADHIENACEVCVDGDGDGYGDLGEPGNLCAADNCPFVSNPNQSDADLDGSGDACDSCPLDPLDDLDADGSCGNADNCPGVANADQANTDGDGFGDACDRCPSVVSAQNRDSDRDGLGDACDADVDGDGLPNEIDPNDDNDAIFDDDGDGVLDPCTGGMSVNCDDNCPLDRNPAQADHDNDGIGDACDMSDGIVDGVTAASTAPGGHYTLAWEPEAGSLTYNVYSGTLGELRQGSYGSCFRRRLLTTYTTLDGFVAPGTGRFFLVTAVYADHEGTLGYGRNETERSMPPPCP